MTTTVREATPDEAGRLHELAAATFRLACPPGTTEEAIADFLATTLSETSFDGYLADPTRTLLVAEVDGSPVGYTMLVFTGPADADVVAAVTAHPIAELSKFYVLQDQHGAGVSGTLMTATLAVARERGSAGVWLGVNQLNGRANRFYEKHGFVIVGTKGFELGGRREDDYVRELVF
ncbi:GNAT family N-acetyltransferase [Parafrigoribacterium humi]|jgi:GNAT superfamily N-acetyltransferase|uniref:GNAT family N-acetyltransferase n=1 Tax=Parafrigoribacterium humi TaxID=3144664 RepID=UPI0032EB002B